jgi:hypothetical protein
LNAAQIRAKFIMDNLNRAGNQADLGVAIRIVREFRRYFTWCADSLTAEDRLSIAEQLRRLECELNKDTEGQP